MSNHGGFSLVETLVALAVFSTAAVGMVALNTSTTRLAAGIDQRFLAGLVAEAVIAETLTDPEALVVGIETGLAVQRQQPLSWTRTITATDRQALLIVDVVVTAEGHEAGLSRLSVLAEVAND